MDRICFGFCLPTDDARVVLGPVADRSECVAWPPTGGARVALGPVADRSECVAWPPTGSARMALGLDGDRSECVAWPQTGGARVALGPVADRSECVAWPQTGGARVALGPEGDRSGCVASRQTSHARRGLGPVAVTRETCGLSTKSHHPPGTLPASGEGSQPTRWAGPSSLPAGPGTCRSVHSGNNRWTAAPPSAACPSGHPRLRRGRRPSANVVRHVKRN